MKEGDDENAALMKAIEEAVGKTVKQSSASVALDGGIQTGTRRDALDASKEFVEEFVAETFLLVLVPAIGLIEFLGRRLAKSDGLHGRRGWR